MLVKTIETAQELKNEFIAYNRDYYSYAACEAIIEYFNEFEDNIELDIIALCGDFTESDEEELRSDFNLEEDEDLDEYLSNNTWHQNLDNGNILYTAF